MSKKLENNGLWESSRMMLPEHRETLIKHKQSTSDPASPELNTRRSLPTEEELKLIRHTILLPIMLTIVESNGRHIEFMASPLKKLYLKATQVLLQHIHTDLVHAKKTLKEKQIKIFEDERIDGNLCYRFICRGYEEPFIMTRDVVRAELSTKIAHYISIMFHEPQLNLSNSYSSKQNS